MILMNNSKSLPTLPKDFNLESSLDSMVGIINQSGIKILTENKLKHILLGKLPGDSLHIRGNKNPFHR